MKLFFSNPFILCCLLSLQLPTLCQELHSQHCCIWSRHYSLECLWWLPHAQKQHFCLPTRRNNSVLFLSRVMISHWTEAFEALICWHYVHHIVQNWLWFFLNHCFSLWIVVLSYKVKHRFNTVIFFAGPIHFISFQCKLMESHSVLYFTHKHFAACKITWLPYKYILFCWQAANVSFLLRSLVAKRCVEPDFFENFVFSNGVNCVTVTCDVESAIAWRGLK